VSGVWYASATLWVFEGGHIVYGTSLIVNPTINGDAVSWSTADGNAHNVSITFVDSMTSDYYWADQGGSASGKLFTGSRQSPGEGPADFRGLVDDD
jgi:plastocyanin